MRKVAITHTQGIIECKETDTLSSCLKYDCCTSRLCNRQECSIKEHEVWPQFGYFDVVDMNRNLLGKECPKWLWMESDSTKGMSMEGEIYFCMPTINVEWYRS